MSSSDTAAQLQQALAIVRDKATSTGMLHELLAMAESQLSRYAKAQDLLDRTGPGGWSRQVYDESLRLASGGQGTTLSASEWELMELFPAKKDALRADVLKTLAEGRDVFGKIKTAIEAELARRAPHEHKAQAAGEQRSNEHAKRRWFRKHAA